MNTSNIQRIAIIGCGYVGTAVGRKLAMLGHDVAATTTSQSRMDELQQAGMTPHRIELHEVDKLRDLVADRDTAILTYGAGRYGDYDSVYVQGARHIVEAVSSSTVRRIIYTSSTRVYGQDDGGWVDETSPTNLSDQKGQLLVQAERVLLHEITNNQQQSVDVSVLRLGGIHGPQRELSPRVVSQAGQTRDDGQSYINLIHLNDIVTVMTKFLPVNHHGLLNLTNDNPQTKRQMYDTIIAAAKLKAIQWTGNDQPAQGKQVSNERIKNLLQISL